MAVKAQAHHMPATCQDYLKMNPPPQQRITIEIPQLEKIESTPLLDIIPKREPLPVIIPPIGDSRQQKLIRKVKPKPTASHIQITRNNVVPFIEGDDDPNPFEYPKSIEHFFAKAELDRTEKRKEDADIPPLMKGTNLYKQNQQVLARIKPFMQPIFKPSLAHDYKQVIWKAQHGLHINHLQKVSRKMHTEYIMQRKQIYYLRRAIRARKIALEMVESNRKFEEKCLTDYEWLTNFTKDAFETFLRENDDETHNASRFAETALKEKLEKTLEVRQLNIQINQLKTDIISTNESLRECKTYMKFLDDIAREIMRKDEEEEIRAIHREQQIKEELIDYLKQGMSLKKAQKMVEKKAKEFSDDHWQLGKHRGSFGTGSIDFITNLNRQVRQHLGLPPDDPAESAAASGGEKDRRVSTGGQAGTSLSPRSIVSSLVNRNASRLVKVLKPDEQRQVFPAIEATGESSVAVVAKPSESGRKSKKPSEGAAKVAGDKKVTQKKSVSSDDRSSSGRYSQDQDTDGYNEKALLKSLDLVPGNEETDKRELASLSFTRPSQLLQIYSDMEEANLSLIQHSQASEELLERVNHQIMATRRALNHRGRLLRSEINHLQENIDMNEEKSNALAMLVEMFTGGNYDVRMQQKLFKVLQKHVAKVYKTAVGSIDHHLNPIMMLTSVEKNFEDLMREIQAMPTDVVVQISRELDKERREMERLEKMNQRKAVQEERKSRQLARAKAPAHRKKGRPLLARSHPPKIVIHLSQAELDRKAEEDEFNYFFGP